MAEGNSLTVTARRCLVRFAKPSSPHTHYTVRDFNKDILWKVIAFPNLFYTVGEWRETEHGKILIR